MTWVISCPHARPGCARLDLLSNKSRVGEELSCARTRMTQLTQIQEKSEAFELAKLSLTREVWGGAKLARAFNRSRLLKLISQQSQLNDIVLCSDTSDMNFARAPR